MIRLELCAVGVEVWVCCGVRGVEVWVWCGCARVSCLSVLSMYLPVHCIGLSHPDLPDDPKDVHCSLCLQALKDVGHCTESS